MHARLYTVSVRGVIIDSLATLPLHEQLFRYHLVAENFDKATAFAKHITWTHMDDLRFVKSIQIASHIDTELLDCTLQFAHLVIDPSMDTKGVLAHHNEMVHSSLKEGEPTATSVEQPKVVIN